jgi:hypothetical protein
MEPDKPKVPGPLPVHSTQTLRETLRWVEEEPDKVREVFPGLSFAEQMSVLLLASGQLRQNLLLSSPYADKLVPMLPEQEIYLTLKEIGLEDALPMISLMNREQLQYVNDLEAWNREHFETDPFLKLLKIILQCGEDKLVEWLETVDPEVLVLFLKHHGSVTKYDITKEPIEDKDQYTSITYDGYYRYRPKRQEIVPILDPVLRALKISNPEQFGMVMESVYMDLPAEVEAEAVRFRSNRLSEKGIPDFEDACEIYRPLTDERFAELSAEMTRTRTIEGTPALYPVRWLPAGSFFREVLGTLGDHPETERIRAELAALGNKTLVADGLEITSVEPLQTSLRKVAGTLTLALEYLEGRDVEKAASWLKRTWLHYLFRLGYSQVGKLAERARKIRDRTGFPWIDRFHYLVESPLEETLRGLIRPQPLFFVGQDAEAPIAFRSFEGMEDLRVASERIAATEAVACFFFDRLDLPPERVKQICLEGGLGDRLDTVRWSQTLFTLWVRRSLTGQTAFRPLVPGDVQSFIKAHFAGTPGTPTRRLDPGFTNALVHWCLEEMGALDEGTKEIIEGWIRSGADRVEEDLRGFDPHRPIDGRFVQCLCMQERNHSEGKR